MASEIKIHLATYLKDAGIKATKQQIDALAKQVKNVNAEVSSGAMESVGSLGRLGGAFGKLAGSLGKIGGIAGAVIAAFKTGCDIGVWLNDKVIWPLLGIKDPIEQLKKENAELEKQAQKAADAWNGALTEWAKGWEREVAGADRARKAVEETTASYLKLQQARAAVEGVKDNGTMLALQRDKFNAMAGAASPEEAAAAGKYHDILLAEESQKQKLAEFDRQATIEAERQIGAEKALHAAKQKRARLQRQMVELDRKQAALDKQDVSRFGLDRSDEADKRLAEMRAKLQPQLDAANADIKKRQQELEAAAIDAGANEQRRANIKESTQLEIDEKRKAYDDYLAYIEQQEAQRAADEYAQVQAQIDKEKQARVKMEQELAAQRISDLRNELALEQQANGDARSRQSAAGSKLSQAWNLYRNQDQMQAVLDEKKAQAMAEAQWEKDFERLKFRRSDWRTAEMGSLSAADESVRQVALAKEEKEAADKAVIETAENTRKLADKLDELLQVK